MSLSFKVTLIQEDEQETRRFVLDEKKATSFSNLQLKITSIFPALDQREPVVSWLDDDGDEVRMANDEELKLALAAKPAPVVKLRVRLGGKKEEGEQCQTAYRMPARFSSHRPTTHIGGPSSGRLPVKSVRSGTYIQLPLAVLLRL